MLIEDNEMLNIIPFLHQTTTSRPASCARAWLNIIPFLHQTTTISLSLHFVELLNIIPFLHQTTTSALVLSIWACWISFHFYIKPQLYTGDVDTPNVEYHSIFTSNHNLFNSIAFLRAVEYHSIFTSNHNYRREHRQWCEVEYHSIFTSNHNLYILQLTGNKLNIIPFLHQTTTYRG